MVGSDIEIARDEMSSIIFRCEKCGMVRKNKIAPDDDREKLLQVLDKKANLR